MLLSKRGLVLRSQIHGFTQRVGGERLPLALAVIKHARLWGEIGNSVSAIEREEEKGYNMDAFDCRSLVAFQQCWCRLTPGNQIVARAYFLSRRYRAKLSNPIIQFLESLQIGSKDDANKSSLSPGDDRSG